MLCLKVFFLGLYGVSSGVNMVISMKKLRM